MNPKPARQVSNHCCVQHNVWTLTLNRYQRDNLLYLLNVCGYPYGNPHAIPEMNFDTGDWIGEIANALGKQIGPYGPDYAFVIDDDDHTNGLPWQLRKSPKDDK